ncbi:DDE_3 domain-containing protein [Trichonephila clavipes]|nr:DDE_3 domain-containing protein [Trichonephila clavipes]
MTQRTHFDDFLRGRIICRLEGRRTIWWYYPRNLKSPSVSSSGLDKDSKMMVKPNQSGRHSGTTCTFVSGAMGTEFEFMDDNTRPHGANIVKECLESEDIAHMNWPAFSPDFKTVEHVGNMLGRRVVAHHPPPTCLPEIRRA